MDEYYIKDARKGLIVEFVTNADKTSYFMMSIQKFKEDS